MVHIFKFLLTKYYGINKLNFIYIKIIKFITASLFLTISPVKGFMLIKVIRF